jgi:3-hydroxymyristoyl/3-hydroxydecanoyl-(acyl carrier protein) dehydratase
MLRAPRLPPVLRHSAARHSPAGAPSVQVDSGLADRSPMLPSNSSSDHPVARGPGGEWDSSELARQGATAVTEGHLAQMMALFRLHTQFLHGQRQAAARALSFDQGRQRASTFPGPSLSRHQLEKLSDVNVPVSSVFGPIFADQRSHRYQIRPPAPPLLYTDRVLGIEGAPGSLRTGRIWAETDLTGGRFGLGPAGRASYLMLGESGQASMLLASWLGADLSHRGEHRYRLLDLDFSLAGPLPAVGETIRSEIALVRQAVAGGLRMFFFEVDQSVGGRPVTNARITAGLFTQEELARPVQVDWDAGRDNRTVEGPFELPEGLAARQEFTASALASLRVGRVADCFGPALAASSGHGRTPLAARPELFLLDAVEALEPGGGPWGRGYMRATQVVTPDDWYFGVHLPGDPCLPGFLLVEGAAQALAFYMTALGTTLGRDGWRFQPTAGVPCRCRFRGGVAPSHTRIVYELFVESVRLGPTPAIVADVVCKLGTRTIFHSRRLGLSLVPDC